jgi:hypothetical protein
MAPAPTPVRRPSRRGASRSGAPSLRSVTAAVQATEREAQRGFFESHLRAT